ncbi:RNB domain-containing ribonuclease [Brachybacterium sp. EF45031]|uniref:RNB domain-containing ribonuclease n=1 Tax=Brachybacterium sillae TaxID=2810536 RepID=UPI00217E4264|nr:RNB domain-containing ribonuclease [Brachybacterium sillae]MCS6710647.1 RNB domain-containing ribonuclease [Brachybacterium sillae]
MPHRPVHLAPDAGSLTADRIRAEIDTLVADSGIPVEFPPEVLAAAEEAAGQDPHAEADRADLTDIPFVTLDPASSTDLDQAMHLERVADGYRVRYAIADVPFVVDHDGPVDHEARRRGATVYLPDRRIPLHPEVLSEGAVSLLPGKGTPAFVWTIALDARGEASEVQLERAVVRSVAKLAYDQAQDELDAGGGHEQMHLLLEIGRLRAALEAERGGASLNVPEQEIVTEDDRVRLTWRTPRPIEDANAQISLLTGMQAARIMLDDGAGILRTMPPAEDRAVERFRRQARALGAPWEDGVPYGEFLRSLTWEDPRHLALLNQATALFRGAGYAAFTRPEEAPEDPRQAAIAAPYAHTTAPLRRLVDRFVLLTCWHLVRGQELPGPLREVLPAVPTMMDSAAGAAGKLERAALELVEIAALVGREGEEFDAVAIDVREASAAAEGREARPARVEVQLQEPPITAWAEGVAELGTALRVRLTRADLERRRVRFEIVAG